MKEYTTVQGDTWDKISYMVYGKEKYMDVLMQNNSSLLDYFIFPAGITLNIPELEAGKSDGLPEWRN